MPSEMSDTPHQEMSFFDHLGDLRSRMMKATAGIVVGCIVAGIYVQEIMDKILLRPVLVAGNAEHKLELQNIRPFGQAMLYFKVIFITGFILAFPWVLWNLWKFVAPGLYENERGWARRITFFTTLCFALGVAFAYFVMIPSMMEFSSQFGSTNVKNILEINEYFGFITTTILSGGLIFELPMIVYVLSRVGLVTPQLMRKFRRHSIVVILIIAAVLTPSPDPVNQVTFALPLYLLFEISIIISAMAVKKQENNA